MTDVTLHVDGDGAVTGTPAGTLTLTVAADGTVTGTVTGTAPAAVWTGVVAGAPCRPTVTIHGSVYPDTAGVQFLVNGVVDERSAARPGGFDTTGPADGSTFHVYPDITLAVGDTVSARWVTVDGVVMESTATVGADDDPDPVDPPAEPDPDPDPVDPPPPPDPDPVPIPTSFPDAASTGLSDPAAVEAGPTLTGKVTLQTGDVLENAEVLDGYIYVAGDDVTIRNVKIHGRSGAHYGIHVNTDAVGVLIEDVFMALHQFERPIGIYGRGWTARRCHITGARSGTQSIGRTVLEDSYIHDSWFNLTDSHGTGSSFHGGHSAVYRHNTIIFDGDRGGSSALSLYGNIGPVHNILVEGNFLLAHAAYLFKGGWSDAKDYGHDIKDVRVVGNVFSRRFYPTGGRSGPVSNWNGGAPGAVWSGNVWEDTGEPV